VEGARQFLFGLRNLELKEAGNLKVGSKISQSSYEDATSRLLLSQFRRNQCKQFLLRSPNGLHDDEQESG